MFERWDEEKLKLLAEGAYNGLVTPMPATEKHIRACYAHMDAQQAEIERLKGELEEANETSARYHVGWQNESRNFIAYIADAKAKSETLQSDLAAHALTLKEALTFAEKIQSLVRDSAPIENRIALIGRHSTDFLARPLSSYQQRAERLEAVAKKYFELIRDGAPYEGRNAECEEIRKLLDKE